MTLINFLIGLPVTLLCLFVQVAVSFWCVRYYVRRSSAVGSGQGFLIGIAPLIVVTVVMMVGNFVQIALWGDLFLGLGEFKHPYDAFYHSAVNFTSLGYARHRDGPRAQAARPARGRKRRADARHDRRDVDGDLAAHDHLLARCRSWHGT